jgi:predicted nucleic acid-binding protein
VKFVLDTNAVSALMKGEAQVLARLRQAGKEQVVVPELIVEDWSRD